MAITKIKDAAVKTSSYTTSAGETKNRYENVGALMQDDKGGMFLMLKRTFNPAGVEVQPGKDSVLISLFDPQPAGQQPARTGAGYQAAPSGRPAHDDSDIPF